MRQDLNRHPAPEELQALVKRVKELREEGLKTWEIARVLGLSKTGLNQRLKRARELAEGL